MSEWSVLAGVVMRADMMVDGISFSRARVGGMDATHKLLALYRTLDRSDINVILLNGCVISYYNVIDLHHLAEVIGLPLICVTYKDSKGLEKSFRERFPEDWQLRVEVYRRNGLRTCMMLHTGYVIYVRFLGMSKEEAVRVLNKFTLHGAVSEPLRVARLLARSIMKKQVHQYG